MRFARTAICALLLIPPLVFAFAASPAEAAGGSATGTSLVVSPTTVQINLNYAGGEVDLHGAAPNGAQVVAIVSSEPGPAYITRKGQMFGFLWMATHRAKVEGVPAVYLVFSSSPLQGLLGKDDPLLARLDPSYPLANKEVLNLDGDGEVMPPKQAKTYLDGLQDIRQSEGLYGLHEDEVGIDGAGWSASVDLPPSAPPGEYSVTAYTIQNGKVSDQQETSFTVQKAGIVSTLANMAHDNPPAYGVLSVFLAVIFGLAIGRLFGQGGH